MWYNAPPEWGVAKWPKAAAFGAAIRRFESCLPSLPGRDRASAGHAVFPGAGAGPRGARKNLVKQIAAWYHTGTLNCGYSSAD